MHHLDHLHAYHAWKELTIHSKVKVHVLHVRKEAFLTMDRQIAQNVPQEHMQYKTDNRNVIHALMVHTTRTLDPPFVLNAQQTRTPHKLDQTHQVSV